ncbi:RING/U-box superfamily protein [Perilla frutescens var. hirtella]|uniref:RING/U-box superfamily protein n=1 Tax=Perilla frutescens var. hirtella TaxID=608512 RepID=A0AAD4PA55_PERFH|nr:RING/U-box superfamily protein [Perilla frutescens var. frutescens]KAH6792594.1 RING/U-box superfamily protein [Perilla frutescens var. hirtella]KAH6831357.1 RING/U-box superfamily protein [Perilla frutescens var. hirtella]
MRNGGSATMVGEFPDFDIEKQQHDGAADGGGPENAAVAQSQDLVDKVIDVVIVDCANKGEPQPERDLNSHEECRVCQEENEEALINLGCLCRGGLAKAHQSCIVKWFNTRGSNKCEICQQVAANVVPPDPQTSYWVWTVDPAFRTQDRQRGCFSPLWVAFSILVGGLLLDVLISVTLGVSALPVNIIIGVIVVLGLGTALRLGLEFCQEWNVRRVVQRVEANASIGYHPAL